MSDHSNDRPVRPASRGMRTPFGENASALFMTSSFVFESAEQARDRFANHESGYLYSRYSNPNVDEFVNAVCRLEGAAAGVAVASGMSAVFTVLAGLLNSGDHVLASHSLFSSTHYLFDKLFPRWGIGCSYVEFAADEGWERLITPQTRLCFIETPANPTLALIDIAAVSAVCRERDIIVVVDNVLATPILQQPLKQGADLVVHSATKYFDGQGRALGGVIVGDRFIIAELIPFVRQTGPSLSPFNAWLFTQGIETLPLRMARHNENALALAGMLAACDHVAAVHYPFLPSHPQYDLARRQMSGGSGVLAFEITGGQAAAFACMNRLENAILTANLGDARTLVTHPATTTHSMLSPTEQRAVGITPGLVRVAVGLEPAGEILADFEQALSLQSFGQ